MKVSPLAIVLSIVASSQSWGTTKGFEVKVGERRSFSISRAVGVVIGSPNVADVQMMGNNHIQVLGSSVGSTQIDVWTSAGKVIKYPLTVKDVPGRARAPVAARSPYLEPWSAARLGGRKLDHAHCGLQPATEAATQALVHARKLLVEEDLRPAIAKLEEALRLSPESVVTRIFLGAAYERQHQAERGMAEYETFVLSCEEDKLTPPLVGVLVDYQQRNGVEQPDSRLLSRRGKLSKQPASVLRQLRAQARAQKRIRSKATGVRASSNRKRLPS
jgi:hypothetical protein